MNMSKLHPMYKEWDVKHFRRLHKARQQQMGWTPVSYVAFYLRLKKWMQLKEAIYTPSDTKMVRNRVDMKPKKKKRYIRLLKFFKLWWKY